MIHHVLLLAGSWRSLQCVMCDSFLARRLALPHFPASCSVVLFAFSFVLPSVLLIQQQLSTFSPNLSVLTATSPWWSGSVGRIGYRVMTSLSWNFPCNSSGRDVYQFGCKLYVKNKNYPAEFEKSDLTDCHLCVLLSIGNQSCLSSHRF